LSDKPLAGDLGVHQFFSPLGGRWLQADPEMEAQARVAARARDEAMEMAL